MLVCVSLLGRIFLFLSMCVCVSSGRSLNFITSNRDFAYWRRPCRHCGHWWRRKRGQRKGKERREWRDAVEMRRSAANGALERSRQCCCNSLALPDRLMHWACYRCALPLNTDTGTTAAAANLRVVNERRWIKAPVQSSRIPLPLTRCLVHCASSVASLIYILPDSIPSILLPAAVSVCFLSVFCVGISVFAVCSSVSASLLVFSPVFALREQYQQQQQQQQQQHLSGVCLHVHTVYELFIYQIFTRSRGHFSTDCLSLFLFGCWNATRPLHWSFGSVSWEFQSSISNNSSIAVRLVLCISVCAHLGW